MMLQPHLLLNTTRRSFIWAGNKHGTLANLSQDRFSPISALIYLLGTQWTKDRIALIGSTHARAAMHDAAWQEISRETQCRVITHTTPGLTDATAEAALARKDAMEADTSASFEARVPHMVINYDTRQRLDPAELGDSTYLAGLASGALSGIPGGTQTALTLLLAGSSRGQVDRGDFPTNHPLVGSWSGHRLGVVPVNSSDVPWHLESITDEVSSLLEAAHLGSYHITSDGTIERTKAFEHGRETYLRQFSQEVAGQ